MDQMNVTVWAGKTKTERDCTTAERARMIHATVGLAGSDAPQIGDPMPGLWHWCAFGPDAMTRDLKTDGHAKGGDFYPRLNYHAACGQVAHWNFTPPYALAM